MAFFKNPFRRGDKGQAPAGAPAAPAPAGTGQPEKPVGRFRRLADKLTGKKPPTPATPPAPAPAPAPAPTGGGAGGGGGDDAPAPARTYPSKIGVTATGVWQISDTEWDGVMHGALTDEEDIRGFMDAMEAGDQEEAVKYVAKAYDDTVADLIDPHASDIRHIGY